MIQQLQASLSREREKATSVEKELRAEIEKVTDQFYYALDPECPCNDLIIC